MTDNNNNNTLSNEITTDRELNDWGNRNIKGFSGVYSRTEFPNVYPFMGPGDSVIINLDPAYSTGGTHWVALRASSEAPIVYYKDSFGAPPPQDIVSTIQDRGLMYCNNIDQKLDEQNCGKRSARFLWRMAKSAKKGHEIESFIASEM